MSRSPLELLAFVSGTIVPIEVVPDPVFSGKMLGEGIAITPIQGLVTAPCAGELIQVHRAGHAYGILAASGARVLLHIGLESVKLNGAVFRPKVKEGDRVVAGQPLVEFDRAELDRKCSSSLAILVVENSDEHPVSWWAEGVVTAGKDVVMQLGTEASRRTASVENTPANLKEVSRKAHVRHKDGLHARPAALVANAARKYVSMVEVVHNGRRANARSVVALMGLAILENAQVEIIASGPDAELVTGAVLAVFEEGDPDSAAAGPYTLAWMPADDSGLAMPQRPAMDGELLGVMASRGIAVGETVRYQPNGTYSEIPEEGLDPGFESARLERALQAVTADIETALEQAGRRGSKDEEAIFAAHRTLIDDPELVGQAVQLISEGKSAAWAWSSTLREQCQVFERSGSLLIAERTADLRDLERQVLCQLLGATIAAQRLPEQAILLAEELTPAELASLDRARLAGIVTQRGGPMSHVAIVARGLGIPVITAVGPELHSIPERQLVVLDAERGCLSWKPSPAQIVSARTRLEHDRRRHAEAQRAALAPVATLDGTPLEVAANIACAGEAEAIIAQGADGVGLLRTELFFMDRQTAPTVEEQRCAYQSVLDALGDRCVIIRTLDVGADKSLAYVPMPQEENPALGLRGIRLGFARMELLRDQLRACLQLQPISRVRILLPMVTDLGEILQARAVMEGLAEEMGIDSLPELGVMIETPAAAVLADQLAEAVDFFSIGTNDLTQYTLAIDRGNAVLGHRLDDMHPAVLRMITSTCEGARLHGKWVGVCGGMASDPLAVPLLVGMGVTELSVSPAMIPEIKMVIRRLDRKACQQASRQAAKLTSAGDVRAFIRDTWKWIDDQAR